MHLAASGAPVVVKRWAVNGSTKVKKTLYKISKLVFLNLKKQANITLMFAILPA
jgi:hypothetical protein